MWPADAEAVASLIQAAFAQLPVPLDPAPSALGVNAAAVSAHLACGGGAVSQTGEAIVGCVFWAERSGGLYVSRLAVAPRARRLGIARSLLGAAEDAAVALHLPRLHLGTRLALIANRRLFAACGFVEVARHAHPGYVEPTWVEMEKLLPGPRRSPAVEGGGEECVAG
jgi:GNAT superfamily N-acetyltransferase